MKRLISLSVTILYVTAFTVFAPEQATAIDRASENPQGGYEFTCAAERSPDHTFSITHAAGEKKAVMLLEGQGYKTEVYPNTDSTAFFHIRNGTHINLLVEHGTGKFNVNYGGTLQGSEYGTCTSPG